MKLLFRILLLIFQAILCLSQVEDFGDSRDFYYAYDTVNSLLISKTNENDKTHSDMTNDEELTLSFEAFGTPFVAKLHVNKELVSENYFEMHQENGKDVVDYPDIRETTRCFYQGVMPDLKDSWAAISTCRGVSGAMFDGSELYYIEPVNSTLNGKHFIYKASDAKPNNFKCGVKDDGDSLTHHSLLNTHETNENAKLRQNSSQRMDQLYVELIIVNDNGEYNKYNKDQRAVIKRNLDILNVVNKLYLPLKVQFKVIGIIVWTVSDKISISSNYNVLYDNFAHYRQNRLLKIKINDAAVLVTSIKMDDSILGAAWRDGICSNKNGAAVITDHAGSMSYISNTFAHEFGHLLGMHHDVRSCLCPVNRCIMYAQAGENTQWSECSEDVVDQLHTGTKHCLANKPNHSIN